MYMKKIIARIVIVRSMLKQTCVIQLMSIEKHIS
jgi:hypothetical protein